MASLPHGRVVLVCAHVCLTKDDHSSRGTASLGYDVAGQAGVVPRVGESRFVNDQVVVGSSVNVVVVKRTHQLIVL